MGMEDAILIAICATMPHSGEDAKARLSKAVDFARSIKDATEGGLVLAHGEQHPRSIPSAMLQRELEEAKHENDTLRANVERLVGELQRVNAELASLRETTAPTMIVPAAGEDDEGEKPRPPKSAKR